MQTYIKLTKPNGFDFHTGKTINYRKSIGKIVKCPNDSMDNTLCSANVIHASDHFFHALNYAELSCAIFEVSGTPVQSQDDKHGFKSFKVLREIDTKNWKAAYYKLMKYMLEDTKKNFDNKKFDYVVKTMDQVIEVFNQASRTGVIDESAAESAARSAWSARTAAESAAWSARSAESAESAAVSAARSAARSAESAAWSAAWSAARSARSAAWSARSAESAAVSAAWSARSAAESAARSAAESAAWNKVKNDKLREYSEKFLELLEE